MVAPVQFDNRYPKHVSERIADAIDLYCEEIYNEGHRNHLGASLIGHECSRYLWYIFRWAKKEHIPAARGRLFNRGHREETRMIEFLRGIGFKVRSEEDGKQLRVLSVNGHFGGSLDSEIWHPQLEYGLGEYKTKGTGRGFVELQEKGVKLAASQHWAQMNVYGRARALKYAVYLSVNKNDDSMHCEYIDLDWSVGLLAEQRASDIINSQFPPEKCSASPAFWLCKSCAMRGPCWNGEALEKNCRSCRFATPEPDARWKCGHPQVNQLIPDHIIPVGCGAYEPIA